MSWAGLWMRVDKGKDMVAFDNMQDRPIKGTTDWQRYYINDYRPIIPGGAALVGFSLKDALPDLSRFVVLLLVWYLLLRWLYFTPRKTDASEPAPNPEQAA